jgi:diacylglycerol kinase (ATP)
MPSAVVLLNPQARAAASRSVERILRPFGSAGWDVELWAGNAPGWTQDATKRAVAQGASAVFGAGGDGLLSEILPAILGTPVALGVVPLGTGNVWARELGLPLDSDAAIKAQLARPPGRVDVGLANGRPFLAIASAGFDAQIVHSVETSSKALGQIAYPLAGVSLAGAARGVMCQVTIDDEPPREIELLAAVATNGRLYGGLVAIVPDARLNDGLLDVVLFSGRGAGDAAAHTVRVLAGLHRTNPSVTMRQARRLRIETPDGALPVQTDGDPRGTTPLDVEVVPGGLLALGIQPASSR